MTIKDLILNSNNILIITGAGVSTASGIPDFRSSDILKNFPLSLEQVLSRGFFYSSPKLFWELYKDIFNFKQIMRSEPNEVHNFLSGLEDLDKDITIVTQNVDGLHFKSGSKKVLEMHGNLNTATCPKCKSEYGIDKIIEHLIPRCSKQNSKGIVCNFILSPDIVLYGDKVLHYEDVLSIAFSCDLLLVMGTSLNVYPVNNLVDILYTNKNIKTVFLNGESTLKDNLFDYVEIGNLLDIVSDLSLV